MRNSSLLLLLLLATAMTAAGQETVSAAPAEKRLMRIGPVEFTTSASPKQVWEAIATEEGVTRWASPAAKIELKLDGAYELYFFPEREPGKRGMEGTKVLSFVPERMLAYTGRPTCPWMKDNGETPWAVYLIEPLSDKETRVTFWAYGFAKGEECEKRFATYDQIMPQELSRLQDALAGRPTTNRHLQNPTATKPEDKKN